MSDHLFIYGTLSTEAVPDDVAKAVEKLKFIGRGFVYGKLYDLGNFPGAKLARGSRSRVHGKVYRLPVNKDVIRSLDAYEECIPSQPSKSLYLRKKVPVTLESGDRIEAWVYEYNGDVSYSPVIRGGDYSKVAA